MTENELKAAAVGIITYVSLIQNDCIPAITPGEVLDNGAFLDNVMFDKALELCSLADMDEVELYQAEDDEDDW